MSAAQKTFALPHIYFDFSSLANGKNLAAPEKFTAQVATWLESDFAGFARILKPGSDCAPDLANIEKVAAAHRQGSSGKTIRNFVLFGTGGSSLGGETIIRALYPADGACKFYFLDNNDPDFLAPHFSLWHPEETLFFVVSKSGTTPETISQFLVAVDWLKKNLPNAQDWKKHIVFCTDPQRGDLRNLAEQEKIATLPIPPAVGGRFSVLTAVGLFPAAFAGINISQLMSGASELAAALAVLAPAQNPAWLLADSLCSQISTKPITILMPYSSRLAIFSRWFCQLWAESLGKMGRGFTPYPALGTVDQHSQVQLYMEGPQDKVIGFLSIQKEKNSLPLPPLACAEKLKAFSALAGHSMAELFQAELLATKSALAERGVPHFSLALKELTPASLGALFYFWEICTANAGSLLGCNPFDQPGVERAKILTKQYLEAAKK